MRCAFVVLLLRFPGTVGSSPSVYLAGYTDGIGDSYAGADERARPAHVREPAPPAGREPGLRPKRQFSIELTLPTQAPDGDKPAVDRLDDGSGSKAAAKTMGVPEDAP